MNGIQKGKPSRQKWNWIHDEVIKIIKYKESTIDHAIYIKVLFDGTVSYTTVSTGNVINTTNNEIVCPELKIFWRSFWDYSPRRIWP